MTNQAVAMKVCMRHALAVCILALCSSACSHPVGQAVSSQDQEFDSGRSESRTARPRNYPNSTIKAGNFWDPRAAAAYLDEREVWWMSWQGAARDHQTFCISCHTAVPYALSRAALRKDLAEDGPSVNERKLIENVTRRTYLWNTVEPYYSDQEYGTGKTIQSRGTEAVLNALVLTNYDSQNGRLSDATRSAFSNMWELQQTTGSNRGSWPWLEFNLAPWEASDSQYYGAALAAAAVGMAPENYRATPKIQGNLQLLYGYLRRHYSEQASLNRLFLLWASAKLPGLLNSAQQKSIVDEVLSKQRADGGWNLPSLAGTWRGWSLSSFLRKWKRNDGTPQDEKSDGYATGLVIFILQQAGTSPDSVRLVQGRFWLVRHQEETQGFWLASSLNKRRTPSSNVGHFMDDAATAYAVLALTKTRPEADGRSGFAPVVAINPGH